MAEFWMNNAGTWRKAAQVWMNNAGTWRQAKEIWANNSGTWRKVFSAFAADFAGAYLYYTKTTATCQATITFNTDGTLSASGIGSKDVDSVTGKSWYLPTTTSIGSSYSIRVDGGAWTSLSSVYSFSATKSSGTGTVSVTKTIEIALTADTATVLYTGTCTAEAEVQV